MEMMRKDGQHQLHQWRIFMTKKCKCGCGKEVKRKFALGHNSRVPGYTSGQYKKDHSVSKETREKMRDAIIGPKLETEHIEKFRQKII